jgi:hypothetical protein
MLNLALVLGHPTGGRGGGLINSLLSFTRDDWNQTKTVTLQAQNLSITASLQEVNAGQYLPGQTYWNIAITARVALVGLPTTLLIGQSSGVVGVTILGFPNTTPRGL